MADAQDKANYEALAVPDDALGNGTEILRAGVFGSRLHMTLRRAFDDPATWGEVLGDITRRIVKLYAAEGRYTRKDAQVAIEQAFAADLGAPVIAARHKSRASARKGTKTTKRKPARAKKAAPRKARR